MAKQTIAGCGGGSGYAVAFIQITFIGHFCILTGTVGFTHNIHRNGYMA